MPELDFFFDHYKTLRPGYTPMKWMRRMFLRLIDGQPPSLVDLPTGAGKTDLIVIWLIALAWGGANRSGCQPVPRRLIWVVNRRVLVQQVFAIAQELHERLTGDGSPELGEVRGGLRAVSGNTDEFFDVVQLRGQVVANRDWAIRPTVPQLIIGTVDQIGSRLLFQGYGLGKWGRPQQAGLLGVDAWVAVDEAHLVPAFVLTLRQLRLRCAAVTDRMPQPLDQVFGRLPFWLTELSATPGLPEPGPRDTQIRSRLRELNKAARGRELTADEQSERQKLEGRVFSLRGEEEKDGAIEDRILAANMRRVEVVSLTVPKDRNADDVFVTSVAGAASKIAKSDGEIRVAIFVRTVKRANAIESRLTKASISESNICKITGRLRGYERDRIIRNNAFRRFLPQRDDEPANPVGGTVFLIGTAAAEVGLDADADVILCDFAPLLTLLQRLGRLDRRGERSKSVSTGGAPPAMKMFVPDEAKSEEEKTEKQKNKEAKAKKEKETCLAAVAKALAGDVEPCSASLMAGAHWLSVAEEEPAASNEQQDTTEDDPDRNKKSDSEELAELATWKVLNPQPDGTCAQPANWLSQQEARVAAGPVVVPPLTDAILDHWCETTEDPSRYLTPHPFLYGLLAEDEGTPLVGVAFRLELEALREASTDSDEDDTEGPSPNAEVIEIFAKFPPQRAELHQIPLSVLREWLASPAATEQPILYRDGEQWCVKPLGKAGSTAVASVTPGMTLVLPASAAMEVPYKKLLGDSQAGETAPCDVLDGVSRDARHRREVKENQRGQMDCHSRGDGAYVWDEPAQKGDKRVTNIPLTVGSGDANEWKPCLRKELRIHGGTYVFRYFKQRRAQTELQYLDDIEGQFGHISRAQADANRLATALAPSNEFLKTLLCAAAFHHDEGKRHKKWQRAFGWGEGQPELAKLHPKLERNTPLRGFRHEWESLCRLGQTDPPPPATVPSAQHALWCELLRHLVAVHHGNLRPSLEDAGLTPGHEPGKQNPLRLQAAGRFARLQNQIGPWRLAYLEALLKTADALASEEEEHGED
jgi:CRISPR-associated endonuclease/helicase Cas3